MAASNRGEFEASDSLLDGSNARATELPPSGAKGARRFLPGGTRSGGSKRRPWALLLILLLLVVPGYYLIGGAIISTVDDDLAFAPAPPAGGKRSVAMVAGLMQRETQQHSWMANTQPFEPGYLLDNMPNYQLGIRYAVLSFMEPLRDQLTRPGRGTSPYDANIQGALGDLSNSPSQFLFPSYESKAKDAIDKLNAYNASLATGAAGFQSRNDALLAVLDKFSQMLGNQSATIERFVEGGQPLATPPVPPSATGAPPVAPPGIEAGTGAVVAEDAPVSASGARLTGRTGWIDTESDDVFYLTKGQLYAIALIMKALGEDAQNELRAAGIQDLWAEAVVLAEAGAELQPWFVTNGAPDSQIVPSHLAAQGFYLMRTRAKMREMYDILRQ